jgi:hypothetical protein
MAEKNERKARAEWTDKLTTSFLDIAQNERAAGHFHENGFKPQVITRMAIEFNRLNGSHQVHQCNLGKMERILYLP